MFEYKRLGLAAMIAIAVPVAAQDSGGADADNATAEQKALINNCSSHKFETVIEVDPVNKRGSRIKLCSNPGASDADWVKTLKDAVDQAGKQTSLPMAAREELIAQLKHEISKYEIVKAPVGQGFVLSDSARANPLEMPTERYEVSSLPPLIAPKVVPQTRPSVDGVVASASGAATVAPKPLRSMRFSVRCLEPGQRGDGSSCDYFEKDTLIAVRAVAGLEEGGTLRFRRRGDERGTVSLVAMQPGKVTRVRLPRELCSGVKTSKVELELLAPGAVVASHRLGPFGLRC